MPCVITIFLKSVEVESSEVDSILLYASRSLQKRKLTSKDERWQPLVRELGIMKKVSFQDKQQYDKKHGGLAKCNIWRSMNNSACRKVGFEGKSEKK